MEQKTYITTSQYADAVGVQGASIRHGLCINGHYLGLRPIKLPNGRLLWPADGVQKILQPEQE